jgi:hypothetical protein
MTRVNIINDLGLEYLYDDTPIKQKNTNEKKQRLIKITQDVFESMVDEGLIKKTDDGYVFVGKRPKKH